MVHVATVVQTAFDTKPGSHSGSGMCRCLVGSDSAHSCAPAAPGRWLYSAFVALIGMRLAYSPNTDVRATPGGVTPGHECP